MKSVNVIKLVNDLVRPANRIYLNVLGFLKVSQIAESVSRYQDTLGGGVQRFRLGFETLFQCGSERFRRALRFYWGWKMRSVLIKVRLVRFGIVGLKAEN